MTLETQPLVQLEAWVQNPYDLAVATARTCYSAKGIVRVEDVSATESARQLRDKISDSTREAGHLTTRQHAHFVFSIDKVSRHFIWAFLHSHPYYNSEQVSQRYVKVAPGNYVVPQLPEKARAIYIATLDQQMRDYQQLIELVFPDVSERFFKTFPTRRRHADQYRAALLKRCYEVARYVLGVATHAYLYHTISALTLMRYHRLCHDLDVPEEARQVVASMVAEVIRVDPDFSRELVDPLPLEDTPEYRILSEFKLDDRCGSKNFIREFDASLSGNRYARLMSATENAESVLADSVRAVFGVPKKEMSDERALTLLLSPKENSHFTDTMNVGTLSRLGRCLNHAHYIFRKKISHTADSQDQRHRMVPGSRPLLARHYTGDDDWIEPLVVRENPQVQEFFTSSMRRTFQAVNQLLDSGIKPAEAFYLLPNAFPIRFVESGDLLNLHHKWKARTCYTAQEEIFFASLEELRDVHAIHPRIAENILAPCFLRYEGGITPYCPEGDRFCGVRVWKQPLSAYEGRTL